MPRIVNHPVLDIPDQENIEFKFNGTKVVGQRGEVITSALFAAGYKVFGHHSKDHAPLGIYCANGQCSQCMVIVNGQPAKGCMVKIEKGMEILSCDKIPDLIPDDRICEIGTVETLTTGVLIIGAGPSGLAAAKTLCEMGIETILVDDKQKPGGKLTLQTHNFFGSFDGCYAGKRGIEIADILTVELDRYKDSSLLEIWLDSPAIGVFHDKKVGIKRGNSYILVKPKILLVATGARERTLFFPGCDLPGVYGAGAFQTLVNRDLVRSSDRILICGGGNVGLIAGYHALQAGIEVAGVIEAAPSCGGYKVHLDKLKRLGVPVDTSHTVLAAHGKESLESVTICKVDSDFKPIEGTEYEVEVDTLLLAVGLSPVDEILNKARAYGMDVYAAGDASEIAEASAAMFSGKIAALRISEKLNGKKVGYSDLASEMEILKSRPGNIHNIDIKKISKGIYPLFWCNQEIPCNPCTSVCRFNSIDLVGGKLMGIPVFNGNGCSGCGQCVLICPGLAVVLVDERYDESNEKALIILPYELSGMLLEKNDLIKTVDINGEEVGSGRIISVRKASVKSRRSLIHIEVPFKDRLKIAGFSYQSVNIDTIPVTDSYNSDSVVCRCERVGENEIRELIRDGYRDFNQLKAELRVGMGACGGKTCTNLIKKIFREEGVPDREIRDPVIRTPEMEVPMSIFTGVVPRHYSEKKKSEPEVPIFSFREDADRSKSESVPHPLFAGGTNGD